MNSVRIVLTIVLIAGSTTLAQTKVNVVSQTSLYRHFLAYANHLESRADEASRSGGDGERFREIYMKRAKLSRGDASMIRDAAVRLEAALKVHDSRASDVINAARIQYGNRVTSLSSPPPVPVQLRQLQLERDDIISRRVAELKTALTSGTAARLDAYIRDEFAANVESQLIPPYRGHDPSKRQPAAFSPRLVAP